MFWFLRVLTCLFFLLISFYLLCALFLVLNWYFCFKIEAMNVFKILADAIRHHFVLSYHWFSLKQCRLYYYFVHLPTYTLLKDKYMSYLRW